MSKLISGFLLLLAVTCHAQSASTRMGARHAGVGYASFALSDEAALFNNVAGLARIDHSAMLFSQEIATDLPGANRTAAAFTLATEVGTLAFGMFRFGDKVYSEQLLSLAAANRFGNTALGIRLNYIQYSADGYGTTGTWTVDFAGLTELTPHLYLGAGIFNLTQSSISEGEKLPVTLVAAIAYQPGTQLHAALEVEKRLGIPITIKFGVEYGISKKLFFRSGANLNPSSLFGGLGAKTRRTHVDFSMNFSQTLGLTHQASAAYKLGRLDK